MVVDIHNSRVQMRKVLVEPLSNLPDNEMDVVCLIVGGDSNHKVYRIALQMIFDN